VYGLQDVVNFLLDLLILLRMLAEQIPGPGEGSGGGFMPCHKEGQALGHHLLIAHGLVIFVSGLQQDGEKIIALCRVVAPLINEALNAVAQNLHSFVSTTIAWRRPTIWQRPERRDTMREIRHGDGHGRAKFIGFGKDIGVKERFADDAHGEIGHVLIDVNNCTIGPGLLHMFAVIAHDLGISGNMAWLERRGHELTLVTVEITFATGNAIPDDGTTERMDGSAFVEVIGMFDQNAVDVLWFVEQDGRERPKMHGADVACACQTL